MVGYTKNKITAAYRSIQLHEPSSNCKLSIEFMTGSKESMLCLKNVIFHACAREGCTGQVTGGTFCSKEKFSSDILCSQMSLEECNELFISVSPLVKRSCQSDLECIYWSRLRTVQPYHVTSFFSLLVCKSIVGTAL